MKKFFVITGLVSALLALGVTFWVSQKSYEEHLASATASQTGVLSSKEAGNASMFEVLAADFLGRPGFEAARVYPKQTQAILEDGVNYAALKEILERYHFRSVIPVLYLYASEGSFEATTVSTVQNTASGLWNSVKERRLPSSEDFKIADLSKEERMNVALGKIHEGGHAFLSRFELVFDPELGEDRAQIIYTRAGAGSISNFFFSGIYNLEEKYHQGEVGVSDGAWAAVDVAVVFAAFKAVKVVKASKGAKGVRVAQQARAGEIVKVSSSRLVPKWAVQSTKYGTLATLVYLAVFHPAVALSAVGFIAETFGTPGVILMFVVATAVLWPLLTLLFGLFKILASATRVLRGLPVPLLSTKAKTGTGGKAVQP